MTLEEARRLLLERGVASMILEELVRVRHANSVARIARLHAVTALAVARSYVSDLE
jgi:hypothetical protein